MSDSRCIWFGRPQVSEWPRPKFESAVNLERCTLWLLAPHTMGTGEGFGHRPARWNKSCCGACGCCNKKSAAAQPVKGRKTAGLRVESGKLMVRRQPAWSGILPITVGLSGWRTVTPYLLADLLISA